MLLRALLPLLLAVLVQDAPAKALLPPFAASEFAGRRARLMELLPDGAIVLDAGPLLKGVAGIDRNTPIFDFSYLAGHHDDDGILALVPREKKTFLFAAGDEKELAAKSGADHVLPVDRFDAFAKEVLSAAGTVHTKVRKGLRDRILAVVPNERIKADVGRRLTELRLVKTAGELAMIRRASDATVQAHIAAMKACKAGLNEGELQKLIEATFTREGCDGQAFPSIVGGGRNGTILHYMENRDPLPEDSLVVCDIGASSRGYATDITRTLPTSGRFAPKQAAAYQCVLDAQKAAEAILKPGASLADLDQAARSVFKERKLTDWSYALSKDPSVNHGLGHFVGLSVHDSGAYGEPFRAGMVITIEPGYYNKKDGWGIRIEDMYLVTATGFERLSAAAPREIAEIEKLMKP